MNKFELALQRHAVIVLDGGLATQLETMGYDLDSELWSARLLESEPRAIIDAHRNYLDAGADCIVSASYQASRKGFMSTGKSAAQADALIVSAVELAKIARAEFLDDNPTKAFQPLVAASVGPYGAAMHDGSEYTGKYGVSAAELREFHFDRLQLLDRSGADVLAVETIPNMTEARVLAELLVDVETPAWVSFCCRDSNSLSDGTSLVTAAALLEGHSRVLAVGINCTRPKYVAELITALRKAVPNKAVLVYPNSGETYNATDNSWSGTACDFDADFDVVAWRAAGAKLIGGCCRTGPDDIAALRQLL
ncbi:MAG: homocysteine S-methyltransferase [Woeseiaceae bacterium]